MTLSTFLAWLSQLIVIVYGGTNLRFWQALVDHRHDLEISCHWEGLARDLALALMPLHFEIKLRLTVDWSLHPQRYPRLIVRVSGGSDGCYLRCRQEIESSELPSTRRFASKSCPDDTFSTSLHLVPKTSLPPIRRGVDSQVRALLMSHIRPWCILQSASLCPLNERRSILTSPS